ncbi:MAG: 3-deoxy-D-manno-octulosonic acid transferase [Nitrospirales bacterium]|nr:MAG: 3-deoxy-D-manno-octulosonic acid transferase [Nitrospirales bacterium]
MGYFLYNVLLLMASPVIVLGLLAKPRCRRGLLQRLGRVPTHLKHLNSPIIWIHAVSLGEVTAVVPFVKELHARHPHCSLVVSTVTETGREAVEQQLGHVAHHCYCPVDFTWAVKAYIRALHPMAFLLIETELWPNLLRLMADQQIPAILVNGRLSSNSFQRYQRIRSFMRQVLSFMTLCLMQTERDAQRIINLGADPEIVRTSGNMKFDHVDAPPEDTHFVTLSRSMLHLAPHEIVLVAGSTHAAEEDQLLRCYRRLCNIMPSLVLLIAPRHIERSQNVEENIRRHGFSCIRRSRLQNDHGTHEEPTTSRVILLDTRGELVSAYALGWIAFVGGTLTPIGGHNLLEPARWGVPVFFGPYTDHCAEVARILSDAGGGVEVQNEDELFHRIKEAHEDASWSTRVGQAAQKALAAHRGVVNKNIQMIQTVVPMLDTVPVEESSAYVLGKMY